MTQTNSPSYVTIMLCSTVVEAHIIKGRLEAEGIAVHIGDENFLAMDPFLAQGSNGFRIQVNLENETRAREILQDLESGRFAIDENDEQV